MLKNILSHRLTLVVGIFAMIAVSGLLFNFIKDSSAGVAKTDTPINNGEITIDGNLVPEWATYTHPSLGYTIEYPKNTLPFVGFGDGPTFTYFYKSTPEENPHFLVSVYPSQGMSVPEWNKTFKTKTLKKIVVSGVDAYIITDSEYPNTSNFQLSTDGVLYSIGFGGLSPTIVSHIIKSFHIDFVPASMKLY